MSNIKAVSMNLIYLKILTRPYFLVDTSGESTKLNSIKPRKDYSFIRIWESEPINLIPTSKYKKCENHNF